LINDPHFEPLGGPGEAWRSGVIVLTWLFLVISRCNRNSQKGRKSMSHEGRRLGIKLLILLCLLVGSITTATFGQDVTVKVEVGDINGKVPLAIAHLWGQTITGLMKDGETYEMARIEIQNNSAQARTFQLKLELQGLGTAATKTVEIGPMDKAIMEGSPILDWNLVSNYVDERVAKLTVELAEGQNVVYSDVLNVPLMGKDDVPMYADSKALYFFLVTRVQPKSKLVSQVINEASRRMGFQLRQGIAGYQGANNPDQMKEDIRKIYKTIQAMNFTYVNTPVSFEEGYQRIKTPSEALQVRTGNCIDGTLVFASCISAIGYNPIIVIVPGHAFVIATIPPQDLSGTRETRRLFNSMTLKGGQPALPSRSYVSWFPIETTVLQERSKQNFALTRMSFEEAMDIAVKRLASEGPSKVILIDVEAWRACGLLPAPEVR
jgi:hypothetical protein